MMRINLPLSDARLPAFLFFLPVPPPLSPCHPVIFFSPVPSSIARRTARDEIDRDRAAQSWLQKQRQRWPESGCNRNSREFGALLSESRRFNQRPTENRWRGEREVVRCRDVRENCHAHHHRYHHPVPRPFVPLSFSLALSPPSLREHGDFQFRS